MEFYLSDYIEYQITLDLQALNVWATEINIKDTFIFSYILKLQNSDSSLVKKMKKGKWVVLDTSRLSIALPMLKQKPDTIRKRVGIMANVGLLKKQDKYINGSNRILVKVSNFYDDAQIYVGQGLKTEEIKGKIFPKGYINLNENNVSHPAKKCRIENGGSGKKLPDEKKVSSGKKVPDIYTTIHSYKEGYKDNSFITKENLVDNSKNRKQKLLELGLKYYPGFSIKPAVMDEINRLLKQNYSPDNIYQICKSYIELKKERIMYPSCIGMEFVNYIKKNISRYKIVSQKSTCPMCKSLYVNKCGKCSYHPNMTDSEIEEIKEMLERKMGKAV